MDAADKRLLAVPIDKGTAPLKRLYGREILRTRSIKIEDSVWHDLEKIAKYEDSSVAQVIRISVRQYIERNVDKLDTSGTPNYREHLDTAHEDGLPRPRGECEECDRIFV
jgi:predicted CopG family antitoxin